MPRAWPEPARKEAIALIKRTHAVGAALLLSGLAWTMAKPALAETGEPAAGRQKATSCQGCHGLDGKSQVPEAPNLAGQVENYLVKALSEFRNGTRQNEAMSIVAPSLSDKDIADLAAYYSSIEIDIIPPAQ